MKQTLIMSKFLKILKGILLYVTIIYFGLFVMGVDSISDKGATWFWSAFGILMALLVACYFTFRNEGIEDYVPSCLQ
jgi:hypothetical protein